MSRVWLERIGVWWGTLSRVILSYGFLTCVLFCPPTRMALQLVAWRFGSIGEPLSLLEKLTFTDQALEIVVAGQTQHTAFTQLEISHFLDVRRVLLGWGAVVIFVLVTNLLLENELRANKLYSPDQLAKNVRIFAIFTVCSTLVIGIFFSSFFEAFHQLLFPAGNYSFSEKSIMIRVFPPLFWLLAVVVLQLGTAATLWWQARQLMKQVDSETNK